MLQLSRLGTICLLALTSIGLAVPTMAQEKKPEPSRAVIAVFELDGAVTESPGDEMMVLFGEKNISLHDLITRMQKAADDPDVKAVVLLSEGGSMGMAQVEEMRQVIKLLRANGKNIYAHCDSMGMRDFVLLSGANRISMVPTGDAWVTGMYAEAPYLRGLLDLLGVKPDFLTCGEYKSAAEMFMRAGPSPEADAMTNWLIDGIFESCIRQIAQGRGADESTVRQWIDEGPYSADKAKKAGMIDAVEFRQEFEQMLRREYGEEIAFERKYGVEKKQQLDLSNPMALFKIWGELLSGGSKKKAPDKPAVAIVYVDGPIIAGKADKSLFAGKTAASTDIRKALDEAARDDSIKAVVLRVDSPGGSATGSEIILDATRRVKAKKPLVVSMGNVAGSGGYYVACGADTIFADENTITGSIGVVAGKLATNEMWSKVGITFKEYKRGANAGILSSAATFTPAERQKLQSWMDEIYDVFKSHVKEIRGDRLTKDLDEMAGGRVYTGRQALELGLIDKIGTLPDAIAFVAKEADLSDYDVRVVPRPKNFIEKLLEDSAGGKDDSKWLSSGTGNASIAQLALPHLRQIDPHRIEAVMRALRQLQTIQDEGATLMMPEIILSR